MNLDPYESVFDDGGVRFIAVISRNDSLDVRFYMALDQHFELDVGSYFIKASHEVYVLYNDLIVGYQEQCNGI